MPKLIELADEIMRFGDTALQDEFIAMAQAADFFLFSLRAQLKAFMAEVKRALERSVSKDASHLSKRLEAQTLTFTQCRTLLHFIQVRARVRVRVRVRVRARVRVSVRG